MTKEELERIKQAYYSGLKVQIWFNGHWENFDARDYSMHSDQFSENRLYRIVGSAYTDIAEKRIAELEKENSRLNLIILGNEEEITDLRKDCEEYSKTFNRQNDEIITLRKERIEAKELLNEFIRISKASDEDFEHDYSELIREAEAFLSGSATDKRGNYESKECWFEALGEGRIMTRYLVKRPKDTVEVLILPNKDGSGYQYVNLTKGHICPCKFATQKDAVADLFREIEKGKVDSFCKLGNLEVGLC